MSTLFSDLERTDEGLAPYGEGSFSYLDRSARAEVVRIRQVLESWYREYPDTSGDLRARFRSPDEIPHQSAAFELYLYALMSGLGLSVDVHPETLSAKDTKPDFLVTSGSGSSFYLEAVLTSNSSTAQQAADRRMDVLYDQIEKIKSRDFFLSLTLQGKPDSQPSGKNLRKQLDEWLGSLRPDAVSTDSLISLPSWEWKHEDWRIEFRAFPRPSEKRGRTDIRVIGMFSPESQWLSTWESIRDTLMSKGNRYGKLDRGLVVAVNFGSKHLDHSDVSQALFGEELFFDPEDNPTGEMDFRQAPNGAWVGPEGPRYTRISAVMMFKDLHPWTFGVRGVTTHLNPWAKYPMGGPVPTLDHVYERDGQLHRTPGKRPFEILGLSEGWPTVA